MYPTTFATDPILIIAIIVGGVIGYLSSGNEDKSSGAIGGALVGGVGCGYLLLQIFIAGLFIVGVIWLFGKLFG